MASNFKDGAVKIADEVLDQIAIQAANDVYGVYEENSDEGFIQSLQGKTTKSAIRNVDGNLVIDLDLSLDKNVNVRKTVKKIQENVKNVVETMTGIHVSRVNINISKLEIWWKELTKGNGFLNSSTKIQSIKLKIWMNY